MICKKCGNDIPNDSKVCPVCSTLQVRQKRRKGLSVRSAVLLSPIINFLLGGFNLVVLLVIGHYPAQMDVGLAHAIRLMYFAYPALKTVNLIFAVLFIASFVLSLVAAYCTERYSRMGIVGPILTIVAHSTQLCWTLLYPTVFYLIVGTVSPILTLTAIIAAVYTVLATAFSVRICKSGIFLI